MSFLYFILLTLFLSYTLSQTCQNVQDISSLLQTGIIQLIQGKFKYSMPSIPLQPLKTDFVHSIFQSNIKYLPQVSKQLHVIFFLFSYIELHLYFFFQQQLRLHSKSRTLFSYQYSSNCIIHHLRSILDYLRYQLFGKLQK